MKKLNLLKFLLCFVSLEVFAQTSTPNNIYGNVKITNGTLDLGDFASDPSPFINGMMYYNTTSGKFKCREAGSTVNCIGSGGGGGITGSGTTGTIPLWSSSSAVTDSLIIEAGGTDTATGNFSINGNTVIGNASGDSCTSNAATWSFPNDTAISCAGGVNGINIGNDTASFDCLNKRMGIGTSTFYNAGSMFEAARNTNTFNYVRVSNTNTGTTAAAGLLVDNDNNSLQFNMYGTGYTTAGQSKQNYGVLRVTSAASGLNIGTDGPVPLEFYTNGVTRAQFSGSNGFLGMGTSAPTFDIDIRPQSGGAHGVQIYSPGQNLSHNHVSVEADDNGGGTLAAYGSAMSLSGLLRHNALHLLSYASSGNSLVVGTLDPSPLIFGTSNAEKMRLDSAGFLGIGTNTPANLLELNGSAANVEGLARNTSSTGLASWYVRNDLAANHNVAIIGYGSARVGNIFGNGGGPLAADNFGFHWGAGVSSATIRVIPNVPLYFATDDTSRMVILGDGKVGIGTDTPGNLLSLGSDGSSGTPVISLGATSDSNTGIFHPSADTLAISVGGTENIRWDTNEQKTSLGQKVHRTASGAGTTTIVLTDYIIGKTAITGGGDTIALPLAATAGSGKIFIIKDESGSAGTNNLTIDPNSVETIDGALTYVISTNYGKATIYSDGTNWFTL